MSTSGNLFLKTLLVRYHPEDSSALLSLMPRKETSQIEELSVAPSLDYSSLLSVTGWMKQIHFSWFLAPIESLPTKARPLCLSILPKQQASQVREMLKISPESLSKTPFFAPVLAAFLHKKIQPKEILPQELLPPSDLAPLLKLNKMQLIHTIDLLGIHDLAADLRQVVDKTYVEKIQKALTREQLQFLHYCMKQPMKWIPPKLGIPGWDGSKKALNALLHKRGLIRLTKALLGQHPSFIWHLLHHLDIGRGEVVKKLLAGKHERAMVPYFRGQVLHLAKRYPG